MPGRVALENTATHSHVSGLEADTTIMMYGQFLVVTFWEGEIDDTKNYTFFTGKWEAAPEDDIRRWTKFESFGPLLGQVEMDGGMSADLSNYPYIFMEHLKPLCIQLQQRANSSVQMIHCLDLPRFLFMPACLPSGWVILLLSSAITLISENVFLDQDNFWPTFVIRFSVGLACFICDLLSGKTFHQENYSLSLSLGLMTSASYL
ncbi:glucose-induced degradation protein [Trifolium repens]|nr:glucose-induced degradation protein [Trifolium repens]